MSSAGSHVLISGSTLLKSCCFFLWPNFSALAPPVGGIWNSSSFFSFSSRTTLFFARRHLRAFEDLCAARGLLKQRLKSLKPLIETSQPFANNTQVADWTKNRTRSNYFGAGRISKIYVVSGRFFSCKIPFLFTIRLKFVLKNEHSQENKLHIQHGKRAWPRSSVIILFSQLLVLQAWVNNIQWSLGCL